MNLKDQLVNNFEKLPIEKQEEVLDFVAFLAGQRDATDHLFGTENNRDYLLAAIDEVEKGENLIRVNLEDLKRGIFPTK